LLHIHLKNRERGIAAIIQALEEIVSSRMI